MRIGERIKYYRQINNISRQELATKFEISIHTLSKYEQGQREPSIDMITMLSDYFNISVDELIGHTCNLSAENSIDMIPQHCETNVNKLSLFAERLKMYRVLKGLTQKELADMVGVTAVTINRYENGQREPDIDLLMKISKFLDISVDSLIGNDEYSNNDRLFELEEENLKLKMKIEQIIKLLKD